MQRRRQTRRCIFYFKSDSKLLPYSLLYSNLSIEVFIASNDFTLSFLKFSGTSPRRPDSDRLFPPPTYPKELLPCCL